MLSKILVLDSKTGNPVNNANVIIKDNENIVFSAKTNKLGLAEINLPKTETNIFYAFVEKNKDIYNRSKKIYNNPHIRDNKKISIKSFSDKEIYKPGEEIYYKFIFSESDSSINTVIPNVEFDVTILTSNNILLNKSKVKTDDFGSASGKFRIPEKTMNGDIYIDIKTNDSKFNKSERHSVKVEEYKRNYLERWKS